jgi:2-methylcitrate dehydratase PrpD
VVSYTERLAEFCAGLQAEDVPETVLAHARLALLDVLGCGLYGSTLPWSRRLVDAVASIRAEGDATVIGSSRTFAPDASALVNGAMIHSFEYDDLHMESFVHPGATVLPAALAQVDHASEPVSGTDLLTALVVGYEVDIRVGLCAGLGLLRKGWHNSAVVGPLGAGAATARLLGLSAELTNQTLGASATQAGGLVSAQFGAMVKRLHPGRAAQSGFYAATLVAAGYTGIDDVFDQAYGGFPSTLTDDFDLEELTSDLGSEWRMLGTGFKVFPASASCYTSIEAALWAHERGIRVEDVEVVRVHCSSATEEHVGWPYEPLTSTTAQMNLRFGGAAALLDGRLDPQRFDVDRLADPDVVALAGRYEVHADPDIDTGGRERRHAIRAEFVLHDGRREVVEIERAHGFGGVPVTTDEVRAKFLANAGTVLGERAHEVIALVDGIREMADARELTRALAETPKI